MGAEPDELRYREFRRSVRGYSPDEVDDLLDEVADELDGLRAERGRLLEELGEARSRIERYESLESSMRSTLARAEKAADDYREAARREAEAAVEDARREAEAMVRDAESRSRRMLADSSGKVERIRDSYEALRQTRHAFDADFRRLLEGYLRLLDEADSATAREIEAPLDERLDHEAIAAARSAAEEEPAHTGLRVDRDSDQESEPLENPGAGGDHETGAGTPEEGHAGRGEDALRGDFLHRRG